jgi:general stress protein 26
LQSSRDVPTDPTSKNATPSASAAREHFVEIVSGFRFAMLVDHARDGAPVARPMSVARCTEDVISFATSIGSEKVEEVTRDPRVLVTFQGKTEFATVNGRATVHQDRALIQRLWKEDWKVWFPDGPDDPAIAIVDVVPERGEYWDQSGLHGLSFLFRAARAFVAGEQVRVDRDDHQRIDLQRS